MQSVEDMIELRKQGLSWEAISKAGHGRYSAYFCEKMVTAKVGPMPIPKGKPEYLKYMHKAADIRRLRSQGLTWSQVGALIGTSHFTARMVVDEVFRERETVRKRARTWKVRAANEAASVQTSIPGRPIGDEIRGELPPARDTRSLTQRLLGDPLPGRSALDRMRQSQVSA